MICRRWVSIYSNVSRKSAIYSGDAADRCEDGGGAGAGALALIRVSGEVMRGEHFLSAFSDSDTTATSARMFVRLLTKEYPVHEDMQEHPADENTPSTRQATPLMNVPGIVNAGASASQPRKADAAEVAVLAEAEDPGIPPQRLQELASEQPIACPAIAANPAAGPELLMWLRNLDAPAVNEAHRLRAQAEQGR